MKQKEDLPDLDKTDERLNQAIEKFARVRTDTKKRSIPKQESDVQLAQ